jgi:hypothetical protein
MWLAAAGFALQIFGMAAGSRARSKQRRAEQESARFSAASYKRKAEITAQGFGQREEQQRRMARLESGKQRAAIAQSGTGLEGSNYDVERQSQIFAELDALNIRYQGQLQEHAFLEQAHQYDLAARGIGSAASAERAAANLNMAGTLLSGADRTGFSFTPDSTSPAPAQYGLMGNYPVMS